MQIWAGVVGVATLNLEYAMQVYLLTLPNCSSSQPVAFARSETQQNSTIHPVQPGGENKHNIHKMCP